MSKLEKMNEKIAEKVTGTFKNIEDSFVEKYLAKDGESVEDAKKRLKEEEEERKLKNEEKKSK